MVFIPYDQSKNTVEIQIIINNNDIKLGINFFELSYGTYI